MDGVARESSIKATQRGEGNSVRRTFVKSRSSLGQIRDSAEIGPERWL